MKPQRRDWLPGYLFISPAALLFLIFVAAPLIAAFGLSLFHWDLLGTPEFAGLDNFRQLVTDGDTIRAVINTFVFAVSSVVTHIGFGMLLALGVHRTMTRGTKYFVRTAYFFPFLVSWAAVALIWKYVLDPSFGLATHDLQQLGLPTANWLASPTWALPTLIVVDWWHTIGYTFIILLAGLQTVPAQLHEAARVDGANAWWRFWSVTLPVMSPTIFFATVITFIGAFQIFDPMLIMTNGGPDGATRSIVMYTYEKGFQSFEVGYAAALSLVLFVVIMIATGPPVPPQPPVGAPVKGRLIDLVLVAGGLLMIAPLVWLIVTALSEPIDAFQLPPRWIPRPPSLENFRQVPDLIPFAQMAWNSLQIAVITTAGSLLTSALAAYAFSRLRFPGRDQIFSVLLAALVVPVQLTVVPVFILMRWLHLVDTTVAIWLPALVNVFGIFFLRQYIASIPRELDEAAIMDGAGHGWILFRVILPLARPGLTALGIFVFEASWNNFFWPYIFLSSPEKMTLPVGLVSLQGAMGGGPAVVLFAAITLVVLPILVLFLIFQRSFIASIASTGLRA